MGTAPLTGREGREESKLELVPTLYYFPRQEGVWRGGTKVPSFPLAGSPKKSPVF